MARLRDIPVIYRRVGAGAFAKRVWAEVLDDHVFIFSAALAYSWLFAIFPFFIFILNCVPILFGRHTDEAVEMFHKFLLASLPDNAAAMLFDNLRPQIEQAIENPRRAVMSFSVVLALWAASGGIGVTMAALDKCYEIDRPRAFYKRRPVAFLLTGWFAVHVFLMLLLLPMGKVFKDWYLGGRAEPGFDATIFVFNAIRFTLATALAFTMLALIYHFGPSIRHKWRWITPGALFTLACWMLLALGFKTYVAIVGDTQYSKTYGTVGGVIVLLLTFYLDAIVLLIGAEINSEIDFEVLGVKRGSRDFLPAENRATPHTFEHARIGLDAGE